MTTTIQKPTTLQSIIERAESRFAQVIGAFDLKRRLQRDATEAEAEFRNSFTAAAMQKMLTARQLASGAEIALSTDESGIAEGERVDFLNRRETFEAIEQMLAQRLKEADALISKRREKLAVEMSGFIRRGGDVAFLNSYPSRHEPEIVNMCVYQLRNAEEQHHVLTAAANRARHILATGGRVPDSLHSGTAVSETINSLIASANMEIPTE